MKWPIGCTLKEKRRGREHSTPGLVSSLLLRTDQLFRRPDLRNHIPCTVALARDDILAVGRPGQRADVDMHLLICIDLFATAGVENAYYAGCALTRKSPIGEVFPIWRPGHRPEGGDWILLDQRICRHIPDDKRGGCAAFSGHPGDKGQVVAARLPGERIAGTIAAGLLENHLAS